MWRVPFDTLPNHLQSEAMRIAKRLHHSNRDAHEWAVHRWWFIMDDRRLGTDPPRALHFVGFKGEEYHSAVRVWGLPDFYHRQNDHRVAGDVAFNDMVVFANGAEAKVCEYTFNDSEQF